MNRIAILVAVLLSLLLVLPSCSTQEVLDKKGETRTIKILLSSPQLPSYRSRSTVVVSEENKIHNVYAVFCNASNHKVYKVVEGKNITEKTATQSTFDVELEVNTVTPRILDCYVISNIKDKVSNFYDWWGAGIDYTRLQQIAISSALTAPINISSGIVMWGKTDAQINLNQTRNDYSVDLLRALARVDVGLGVSADKWDGKDKNQQPIPFDLKEVYIMRSTNEYSFIPLESAYSQSDKKVTKASPIGSNLPLTSKFKYSVLAGAKSLTESIYIPEQNILMGAGGALNDANHTERCAIVVGGTYDGAMNYYRIDFMAGTALTDVLRNHLYQINITSVKGAGSSTPDEAYSNKTSAIIATVLPWEPNSQDISFDGADYIHIAERDIQLPGNKDMSVKVAVESSVDPSDWEMTLDNGSVQKKGGKGDLKIENDDFVVERPSTPNGGYFVITTKTVLKDGEKKKATLLVKVKRLSMKIFITQNPDIPVDWINGGSIGKEL